MALAKSHAVLSHLFDSCLNGISFTEFLILYHLNQAENEQLRRVDLAKKIGLTPSGVTRMLAPMEKIGLVKTAQPQQDARARFVRLSSAGKAKMQDALERLDSVGEDILPADKQKMNDLTKSLVDISGKALMR